MSLNDDTPTNSCVSLRFHDSVLGGGGRGAEGSSTSAIQPFPSHTMAPLGTTVAFARGVNKQPVVARKDTRPVDTKER